MTRMGVYALAFTGSVVVRLFALPLPFAAEAACAQWDASGDMILHQANGYRPSFTLQRSGSELHGSAAYTVTTPSCVERANCSQILGDVAGSIAGDSFEITAYWKNGSVGVYRGTVDAHGGLEGTTYDRSHPNRRRIGTANERSAVRQVPKRHHLRRNLRHRRRQLHEIESVPLPRGGTDKLYKDPTYKYFKVKP